MCQCVGVFYNETRFPSACDLYAFNSKKNVNIIDNWASSWMYVSFSAYQLFKSCRGKTGNQKYDWASRAVKIRPGFIHKDVGDTWGSDILTPSNSPKLLTKKSRRSQNAFTIAETASPPAYPSPKAATAAFWDTLQAPEVDWEQQSIGIS